MDGGLCSQEERFTYIASGEGLSLLGVPCKAESESTFFAQVAYSIKFPGNERWGPWDKEAGEEGKLSQGCLAVLGEWWTGAPCCRGPAEQSGPPEPQKGNVSPPARVLWVECCPGNVNSLPCI